MPTSDVERLAPRPDRDFDSAQRSLSRQFKVAFERFRVNEVRPEAESMQALASRGICTKTHTRFATKTAAVPPRANDNARPSTVKAPPTPDRPHMKSAISLVVLVVIFVGFLIVFKARLAGNAGNGPWPFHSKKPLTTPEQVLYFRLVSALPDHIVLAQVQLFRFLGVKKGEKFHQWNN